MPLFDAVRDTVYVGTQKETTTEDLLKQIEELQNKNEALKEELKMTNETMSNMIAEFGDLFSGKTGT